MIEGYKRPEKDTRKEVELLDKNRGHEHYNIHIDAGTYRIDFGFRNFGEHESDWFSRSSDREADWKIPFKFDYDHPKVKQLEKILFSENKNFNNPDKVSNLVRKFDELIKSMDINEPEYNNSLSDIAVSGKGACAAKSILFGSLLARNTNLETQAIDGQYGQVQDKVSYPFHHLWMRITDGKYVYLFDPMYEKLAVFEKDAKLFYPVNEQYSHFNNLTPVCWPARKLIRQMNIQRCSGVRRVKAFDNDGSEIYVDNEDSLSAQLANQIEFAFEIDKEQELEIQDGAIKTGVGNTLLYFPVKSFRKIKE